MISFSRAAVALLAAVALAGCGSAPPPSAIVPNVVGQTLDAAKSVLVTAGFPADSQDLLRDRNPLLDSDWTVCTQTPGPVAATVAGTTVDLGVVKKAETCPHAAPAARSSATPTRAAATTAARHPTGSAQPRPTPATGGNNSASTRAAVGSVHSGTFCDPPATGISDRGTSMVCAPAADGRNRWRRA
jgi:beta-lactam-binding protein with PASTA domain